MELMIAIVIVGILAAIAFPSYQDAVRKSHRSDAHAGLIKMQLAQENRRMIENSYTAVFGVNANDVKEVISDYYTFTMANATGSTYTLVATAKSTQTSDTSCTPMTLDHNGTKSPAACW